MTKEQELKDKIAEVLELFYDLAIKPTVNKEKLIDLYTKRFVSLFTSERDSTIEEIEKKVNKLRFVKSSHKNNDACREEVVENVVKLEKWIAHLKLGCKSLEGKEKK